MKDLDEYNIDNYNDTVRKINILCGVGGITSVLLGFIFTYIGYTKLAPGYLLLSHACYAGAMIFVIVLLESKFQEKPLSCEQVEKLPVYGQKKKVLK